MDVNSLLVVGASAGGTEALARLVAQLPKDFPAPVFIVRHMAADSTAEVLVRTLERNCSLACVEAKDGQTFAIGRIYVAPSDHHIMVGKGRIKVTKGARENRSRPGIDPLFRSAAVAYGNKVIGVVLTGYLDDGTAGMAAIKRCGGTCVVQEPSDAAYPDMPRNVLQQVAVDYRVPLAEMGALLYKLALRTRGPGKPPPKDIVIEAKIAERVLSDLKSVEAVGDQAPFNCPDCGGVLWEVAQGKSLRYRCHTGHAFTCTVLLAAQTAKIEETLWVALRMFEERKNLLLTMADQSGRGFSPGAAERANDSEVHIRRIRSMLLSGDKASSGDVKA